MLASKQSALNTFPHVLHKILRTSEDTSDPPSYSAKGKWQSEYSDDNSNEADDCFF